MRQMSFQSGSTFRIDTLVNQTLQPGLGVFLIRTPPFLPNIALRIFFPAFRSDTLTCSIVILQVRVYGGLHPNKPPNPSGNQFKVILRRLHSLVYHICIFNMPT